MVLNRFRAFGFHLLGSAVVAICSAALVYLLWYPAPLQLATGVTDIFLLLLVVDVVVGPVITLIVFDTAKKELKRDMAIVLALQLSALLYGINTVFVARPLYVVYNAGRFDIAYANDISDEKLAKVSVPDFKTVSWLGPRTISARRPDDTKRRTDILISSLSGGDDLAQMPEYYVPYLQEKAAILESLQPIENLERFNPNQVLAVTELVARFNSRRLSVGYLPLRGKTKDLTVVVAKDSGEVLEITDLSPW